MAQLANTAEHKEELIRLLKYDLQDDYYGEKTTRLVKLAAALQRQAAKCKEEE